MHKHCFLNNKILFLFPSRIDKTNIHSVAAIHAHFREYLHMKLLEIEFNAIFQSFGLPFMFFLFSFLVTFLSAIMIKLRQQLFQDPACLMFPIAQTNCLLIYLLIGTISGRMNLMSQNAIWKLKMKSNFLRNKECSLIASSISSLKIKFGDNFIDNKTPFVMLNFCLHQIVNILLVSH